MKTHRGRFRADSKLEKRLARNGIIFLIPLMLGLTLFFVFPILRSLISSFSTMTMTENGFDVKFKGLGNYAQALFSHPTYRQTVTRAMRNMIITSPLVIIFSFFVAAVLNQKFAGRTFFRVVLFLPVIMLSAALLSVQDSDTLTSAMSGFTAYKDTFGGGAVTFTARIAAALEGIGFDESISNTVTAVVDQIYGVIQISGIQILILLTGMQSISPSLYEAAKVEGGTSWEIFWKITFPIVSPLILTCVIYTIVDSFTSSDNGVMKMIQTIAETNQNYPLSYAMSWIYFVLVAAFLGIVSLLMSRMVFYQEK